jgi:hypothetical protein
MFQRPTAQRGHRAQPQRLVAAPSMLLQECSHSLPPNACCIVGFPWYFGETDARNELARFGVPTLVRLYEDPINGCSRGIVLAQFGNPLALTAVAKELVDAGPAHPLTVLPFHLSPQWDPLTAPPPIPHDVFGRSIARGKEPFGYGPSMLAVRGVALGLPNTVSAEGHEELLAIRKRHRVEEAPAAAADAAPPPAYTAPAA